MSTVALRSSSGWSYPVLSAGALAGVLAVHEVGPAGAPKPRLLARVREAIIDFATNQIVIRAGKGHKDRVTMLPAAVKEQCFGCRRSRRSLSLSVRRHGVQEPRT